MKLLQEGLELFPRPVRDEHDLAVCDLAHLPTDSGKPLQREAHQALSLPVRRGRFRRKKIAHPYVHPDAESCSRRTFDLLEPLPRFPMAEQELLGHGRSEEPRLNSSHGYISYAVFCLKKKK